MRDRHPEVPTIYFANGGSCFLSQRDMPVDGLSVDWRVSMAAARAAAGPGRVLQGNVDPMVLYGSEKLIRSAVRDCIRQAGGNHVLNLGHGVEKDTPEHAVEIFVDEARQTHIVKV